MADHNFGTFLPLTDCATMLTSVLTNSSFGSSVEDDSLNDLPSISSPSSLEVSHEDPPDNSNIVDVCLESQMAVKNFLLYFKCDFWMAQMCVITSTFYFSWGANFQGAYQYFGVLQAVV